MPESSSQEIFVAWYAAIIGTISFFFAVYNIMRDRARIKIAFKKI